MKSKDTARAHGCAGSVDREGTFGRASVPVAEPFGDACVAPEFEARAPESPSLAGVADAGAVGGARDAYAPRAFVDEGAVDTIHQANATFLALIAGRAAVAGESAFGIAPPVVERVARLDAAVRRRAAHCPYTLFDLRFADAPFWAAVAQEAAAHLADERIADAVAAAAAPVASEAAAGAAPRPVAFGSAAPAAPAAPAALAATVPAAAGVPGRSVRTVLEVARGDGHVAVFALKAVFLAWHLARNPDGMAIVALGMTPAVVETWRGMPLSALDRCAGAALPFLAARWGAHPRFWPRLLDAAEHAGADGGERVRMLGLQLLATQNCRGYLPRRTRR